MSDRPDEDVLDRVEALEEALEDLRRELEPRRGPFGLPPPPRPRDVLRFTDEYAIPTAIAVLEANVRMLELLQAALRGTRGPSERDDVPGRATALGRSTVERVDRALADLQVAIEDGDLPRNAEARSLLEEARRLNEEIRTALEGPRSRGSGGVRRDDDPRTRRVDRDDRAVGGIDEGEAVEIDVEAELESIKDDLDEGDGDEPGTDDDRLDDGDEA